MSSPGSDHGDRAAAAIGPVFRSMRRGRAGHGWLLLGSAGPGRESAARALAAGFLCESGPGEPCGSCRACRATVAGTHPDLCRIVPGSKSRQILIEQVRDLEARLSRRPIWGSRRVGIVEEADRMTLQAANAFLKTLEEPPAGTLLALTANAALGLPETIVSRCQRIHVGETDDADRPEWLGELETALAGLDARADDPLGGVGRLYGTLATVTSVLERLASETREPFAAPEDADESLARRLRREHDAREQSRYVAERRRVVESMAAWFRDVLAATLQAEGALDLDDDRLSRVRAAAAALTPDHAEHRLAAVHDLQRDLDRNVQEALAFENCFLRGITPGE